MPAMPATQPRKQRFKKQIAPTKRKIVSAALSIPEELYMKALKVADLKTDGNFSRYARGLIEKDLAAKA